MTFLAPNPKTKQKKFTTTVTLIRVNPNVNDEANMFFCNDCKNAVAQYKGEVIKIHPGEVEVDAPLIVQCSNPKCNRKYLFNYFVEEIDG